MIVLGIDPGLDGGLALIDEMPHRLLLEPMPTLPGGKRELDDQKLAELLRAWAPGHVFIERVHAMPKQGVSSSFRFGEGCGVIRGIIAALGLPHTYVTPQAWMKVMLAGGPTRGDKGVAMKRCAELWPGTDFRASARARLPHSGLCDSALLAEYGRRLLAGGAR